MVKRVIVAEPRGFCAGVEMAIKALSFLVHSFKPPIYCYHEIVHNKIVVNRFKEQGVVFINSIDEAPAGAIVMLSAHGSAPNIVEKSQHEGRLSINAVCPLVTKVHHEAKTRAKKGFEIIYVGHKNHDEAIGTMAVAPENIHLVTNEDELREVTAKFKPGIPVALLSQTTLAMNEWEHLEKQARQRFPDMWTAGRSDLCFATTNRQSALKKLAEICDVLIIIGSSNSSNTLALENVARDIGLKRIFRIDTVAQLDECDLQEEDVVGITAGASAPDDIVQEVVNACQAREGIDTLSTIEEDEYFPPPSQLRELAVNLNYACAAIFGSQREHNVSNVSQTDFKRVFSGDRSYTASEALLGEPKLSYSPPLEVI